MIVKVEIEIALPHPRDGYESQSRDPPTQAGEEPEPHERHHIGFAVGLFYVPAAVAMAAATGWREPVLLMPLRTCHDIVRLMCDD
jgi:hypothetical protein